MRLATVRLGRGRTAAARVDEGTVVEVAPGDVGDLLRRPGGIDAARTAQGPQHKLDSVDLAPVVSSPGKIICVGLNYRDHIEEMGRDIPEHPTLFAKYPESLIGPYDSIELPGESDCVDWEAELAVVIGTPGRRIQPSEALGHIAGFTVINDVTVRDWQRRTTQWLQGKTFETTTPLGPFLVTSDDAALKMTGSTVVAAITTMVNGQIMQKSNTRHLVFDSGYLVAYVSSIVTLQPGDVIATGTPAGVGGGRVPPRFLADGDELVTEIDGIGCCRNRCRRR